MAGDLVTERRYPLEPLAEATGESCQALGRLLGLSGSSWTVVRDQGAGEKAAERYAVRLGVHPYTVWPEMADHVAADVLARERATRNKAMRKWRRKREVRERLREVNRTYYAESAEAIRLKARQRYWNDPEKYREAKRQSDQARRAS